jgi:hypothetical protein
MCVCVCVCVAACNEVDVLHLSRGAVVESFWTLQAEVRNSNSNSNSNSNASRPQNHYDRTGCHVSKLAALCAWVLQHCGCAF